MMLVQSLAGGSHWTSRTWVTLQHPWPPILKILGDEGERPKGDMPRAGLTTACTYQERPAAWGCAAVYPWQGTHCLPAGIQQITDTSLYHLPTWERVSQAAQKSQDWYKIMIFFFFCSKEIIVIGPFIPPREGLILGSFLGLGNHTESPCDS